MHLLKNFGTGGATGTKASTGTAPGKNSYFSSLSLAYFYYLLSA
jgi:hypothetical protein